VLERFEIAVRGVAAGQGLPYSPQVFEQLYPFLPNFLEQRANELVMLDYARQRGITVAPEAIDEIVADVRRTTGDDDDVRPAAQRGRLPRRGAAARADRESELVQRAFEAIRERGRR
jgi:hypothetical protein